MGLFYPLPGKEALFTFALPMFPFQTMLLSSRVLYLHGKAWQGAEKQAGFSFWGKSGFFIAWRVKTIMDKYQMINNDLMRVYSKTLFLSEVTGFISTKDRLSLSTDSTFGLHCIYEDMLLDLLRIKASIDITKTE